MKNFIFTILALSALLFACNTTAKKTETSQNQQKFGDSTITEEGAQDVANIYSLMEGKDSLDLKLSGKIAEVCIKKGCWMNLVVNDSTNMRVGFKDYAFFMPKDCSGKTAIIEGFAYRDTTSVEDLQHYAEDEGLSKEEIAKITQPKVEIGFEAKGVILK